jgi:phosphohistidine phosphatase
LDERRDDMRLLLIRHAEASDDPPRQLTEAGRRQQQLVSEALRRMGITFERLLSSPLVRARETAEIIARAFEFGGTIEETPALGDDFTVDALLAGLAVLPLDATVACVGHEPYTSRFAAQLLHPDGRLSVEVKKSGVVGIQCKGHPERGNGRLLFAFRPDELLRLLGER